MASKLIYLVLALGLLSASKSFAQVSISGLVQPMEHVRVLHFTSDNGLPQNSASSTQFDEMGNLWVATQGGLVVFNGLKFVKPLAPGARMRFSQIQKGIDGSLYTWDNNFQLYRINSKELDIESVSTPSERGDSLFWKTITGSPNDHFQKFPFEELASYKPVRTLSNHLYFKVDSVLYAFRNKLTILKNHQAKSQIFAIGNNLYVYDGSTSAEVYTDAVFKSRLKLKSDASCSLQQLRSILEKGFIFNANTKTFAVYEQTIYQLQETNLELFAVKLVQDLPVFENLDHALYNEPTNQFVFGTLSDGFYIVEKTAFNNTHAGPLNNYTKKQNDYIKIVYSLAALKNGDFIDGNGFIYPHNGEKPYLFKTDLCNKMLVNDRFDHVWYLQANTNKLIECDNKLVQINEYSTLNDNNVRYLDRAGDDTIYFASKQQLYWILKRGTQTSVAKILESSQSIENIYVDSSRNLWLLTVKGIYIFNPLTNKIDHFAASEQRYYRSVFRSKSGNIFLTTYTDGLFRLSGNKLIPMPIDKNGYLLNVHAIAEDRNGYFWMSTNRGVFRCLEKDLLACTDKSSSEVFYQYFDRTYGYLNNEFNGGGSKSVIANKDGMIAFSNMTGVVFLRPSEVPPMVPKGQLYFYRVSVDDSSVVNLTQQITLSPDFHKIKLYIGTSFFTANQNLNIQYRIVGINNLWRSVADDQSMELIELPAGLYELEARALSGFGKENYSKVKLKILVSKPWYQKLWFLGLCVIALIALVYGVNHLHLRNTLKQKEKLEFLIKDKTLDLERSVNFLRESNLQNDIVNSILSDHIREYLKIFQTTSSDGANDGTGQLARESFVTIDTLKLTHLYNILVNFLGWLSKRNQTSTNFIEVAPIVFFDRLKKRKAKSLIIQNSPTEEPGYFIKTEIQLLDLICDCLIDNLSLTGAETGINVSTSKPIDNFVKVSLSTHSPVSQHEKSSATPIKPTLSRSEVNIESSQLGYYFATELAEKIDAHVLIYQLSGKISHVELLLPVVFYPSPNKAIQTKLV